MFGRKPTINNLWVGATDSYLGIEAKKVFPDSILCNAELYQEIFKKSLVVDSIYTALGDVDVLELRDLLLRAKNIYYIPPSEWKDRSSEIFTIELLNLFKEKIKHGIEFINQPRLVDDQIKSLARERTSNNPTLFAVGCSVCKGVGVPSGNMFAKHLQKELDMPLVLLAESSSSISWAADQILRSDIRAGDIVVWAVTGTSRTWWFDIVQTDINETLSLENYNLYTIDKHRNDSVVKNYIVQGKNHLLVQSIRQIQQVENFCKKTGARFYFSVLPLSDDYSLNVMDRVFNNTAGYVKIDYGANTKWLDLGHDRLHPGEITHKHIADSFLNVIATQEI